MLHILPNVLCQPVLAALACARFTRSPHSGGRARYTEETGRAMSGLTFGDTQIALRAAAQLPAEVPSSGRDPYGPSSAPSHLCGLIAAFAHS